MAKGVASPWLPGRHNNTNDGSGGFKENAPTQVGGRPPAALPLIGGKVGSSPSKPLAEQFRLGHAPWFPTRGGITANCAPQAARWIFLSTTSRHHHQRCPQGKSQPSKATPYRQAARSLGLALAGATTDATCRTVAIGRPCIASAMEGLMGVALLPPAEMKNRNLGLPNLSGYQASKMVAVSFFRMARPPSPKIWKIDHA